MYVSHMKDLLFLIPEIEDIDRIAFQIAVNKFFNTFIEFLNFIESI